MITDTTNALERNFNLAKKFVEISQEGKVNVLLKSHSEIDAKDSLTLYMVGKLYAKEAELCESEAVSNDELAEELGLPGGTVRRALVELRNERKITQAKRGLHSIKTNLLERILNDIALKVDEKID